MEENLEAVTAPFEPGEKIVKRRTALGGDQAQTQGELWQRLFSVAFHEPRRCQGSEGFTAAQLEMAEGKERIDIADDELQATGWGIEIELAATTDLYSVDDLLPALGQDLADAGMISPPQDGIQLADDGIALPFFDQLEVKMTALCEAWSLYLSDHPNRGKGLGENLANLFGQLRNAVGGLAERSM